MIFVSFTIVHVAGLTQKISDILTYRYVDPAAFDPDDRSQVGLPCLQHHCTVANMFVLCQTTIHDPYLGYDVPDTGLRHERGRGGHGEQLPDPSSCKQMAEPALRETPRVSPC